MTILSVTGLSHRFGGVLALDNVSLDIEQGRITGLVGPNGAGKTTLFSLIAGELRTQHGQIRFTGKDMTRAPAHAMARAGLVRTFQHARPLHTSVLDNVLVAAHLRHRRLAVARHMARETCRMVGLDDVADRPATLLPAASRKRLELARALATEPQLILLDEVLAGLNPDEGLEASRLITRIQGLGITIVMVEHVMELLMPVCDTVIVLDQGRKIFHGSPDAARRDQTVIDAYLGSHDAPRN